MAKIDIPESSIAGGARTQERERPKKEITPVANAKVQKESIGKQILRRLIVDDISEIRKNIEENIVDTVSDSINEAILNTIIDSATSIFGSSKRRSARSSVVERSSIAPTRTRSERVRRFDDDDRETKVRDVSFGTREEAEDVLWQMRGLIDEYDEATVMDLFQLSSVHTEFTDEDFGWTDLTNAETYRSRGRYFLKLPRFVSLKEERRR